MGYVYGQSSEAQTALVERANRLGIDVEQLRRLESNVDKEKEALEAELERVKRAKERATRTATYKPSPEAIAWRDAHAEDLAKMPAPLYGGQHNLHLATLEFLKHEGRDGKANGCGTYAGYQTHKRNQDKPCADCEAAHRDYVKEYRRKKGLTKSTLLPLDATCPNCGHHVMEQAVAA